MKTLQPQCTHSEAPHIAGAYVSWCLLLGCEGAERDVSQCGCSEGAELLAQCGKGLGGVGGGACETPRKHYNSVVKWMEIWGLP